MAAAEPVATADRLTTTRRLLVLVVIVLSGLAGVQLFALADQTDAYFAWTVSPPMAAAFMGAAYWSVTLASIAGFVDGRWSPFRALLPVATLATGLVLVATVLHLDRFHLGAAQPLPLIAAWVWLAVYVVVPVLFAALWVLGRRGRAGSGAVPDAEAPNGGMVPAWVRSGLATVGVAVGLVALVLFLSPGTFAWPWALTPLTSRMTAAFLGAFASIAFAISEDGRRVQVRVAALAMVGFGVLQALAVVRFGSQVALSSPSGLAWLLLLVVSVALGGGALVGRPARAAAASSV